MPSVSIRRRWQRIREWTLYQVFFPIRLVFNLWMRHKNYVLIYCTIGDGIGDALALSTLLRSLHEQRGCKGIIFSMVPQLFVNNPKVIHNIGYHELSSLSRSLLKSFCRAMRGPYAVCFGGEVWTLGTSPLSLWELDDSRGPGWMWLTHMVPDKNIAIDPSTSRPEIFFSEEERLDFSKKFKALSEPFALLKATVGVNRHGAANLKNWSTDKIGAVIKETPQIQWIQVGQAGEVAIPGALNLLGQTTLREVLYLLSKAKILLSVEGFLTHASAAFGTPCIVPFTGVHEPQGLLYSNTIAVLPDPIPSCMPCWKQVCTTAGMPCQANISTKAVKSALNEILMQ